CLRTNVTCATGVLHEDFNECHCSRTWILEAVWRVRFEEMHLAGRNRFSLFFSFRSEKDLHSTLNRNKQMKRAFIVDMRRPHSAGIELHTCDAKIGVVHDCLRTHARVAAALSALLGPP